MDTPHPDRPTVSLIVGTALLAMLVAGCSDSGSSNGTSVTYQFCPENAPIWVGLQDGSDAWKQLSLNESNSYTFTITKGKGGLAAVVPSNGGYTLGVIYAATSEFAAESHYDNQQVGCGSKTVNGSVANVADGSYATVGIGYGSTVAGTSSSDFSVDGVPDGSRELVATMANGDDDRVEKYIVRRDVNVPDGGTLDPLDFASSEAFNPASASLTVSGLGATYANIGSSLLGQARTETVNGFAAFAVNNETIGYDAIPTAKLLSDEVQLLFGTVSTSTEHLESGVYFRTVADRELAFGPTLSDPTFSIVSSDPYLRPRMQLPGQSSYDGEVDVFYDQDSRSAFIFQTAGYAGGLPATWDIQLPDLSGVAGFDNTWGLTGSAGTSWSATAYGGRLLFLDSSVPPDGSTYELAGKFGENLPTLAAGRVRGLDVERVPRRIRGHEIFIKRR
jgi:hypothetical protein